MYHNTHLIMESATRAVRSLKLLDWQLRWSWEHTFGETLPVLDLYSKHHSLSCDIDHCDFISPRNSKAAYS